MKAPLVSRTEAEALVREHGSPLYLYRRDVIRKRYAELLGSIAYPKTRIFYACKANTNPEILMTLLALGASIECVSRGEVERALETGFAPQRISYTCSNIPREELEWVMEKGVSVHLDSLLQIEWWGEKRPNSRISIRINRGFGAGATSHIITGGPESKFGIYYTDIPKAKALAKKHGLTVVGLQQHIGSSILKPASFMRAMKLLFESARQFPQLEYMDFGGGFGIPYMPDQEPLDVASLGASMARSFEKFCGQYGRPLELRIEPGRYLVAEAGALLARVVDIKKTPRHIFVGVDTGFNHMIRPAFYGSYHRIYNLSNPKGRPQSATVVGYVCESSDRFATNRKIPTPRIGDLLLFADAGAYGYSMASDYNLRPKPAEVMLD